MRVSVSILISIAVPFFTNIGANGAKILFLCPVPALSHQKMYKEVWRELSMRGHKVFVVTPNPAHNESMVNLTEYDISSIGEFRDIQIKPEWKMAFFKKPTFLGMIVRQFIMQWFSGDGMEFLYNHPEVKRLVKEHSHFDACILEWFHPAVAVYGHLFQCPTIGIGSNGLPVQMLDGVGKISHPITEPEQDLPILRNKITFSQRLWSAFWAVFVRLHHKYSLLPKEDARIRKYYGNDIPYLGTLERNMSLIILNRNTVFHRPVANLPNVIELGSVKYERPNMKVDLNLKKFLEASTQGVIYFSLGTSMDGVSMPPNYVAVLQSTFKNLPYNVVWKWENTSMQNKPPNVFISQFVPQIYVLEHPNVKLFITQGGLQSIEETIAAHRPIIGIPFHSDQTTNVDTCVMYGMGKMLDLEDLTEDTLRSYIEEIMSNTSYSENAKKLDKLMKDQPQDGLEKAIWWIEYVIRHKGARHLRSYAVDLPWWQYLMIDVLAVVSAVVLSLILILYVAAKILFKVARGVFGKGSPKRNLKKKKE